MTSEAVDPTSEADRRDPEGTDPARWRILTVTLVVGFMVLLDVTIVNVALPSMREGLSAGAGEIQWVVSGYALAFGLTLVTGGRLGDAYGRRLLMVVGLVGFVAASAAAGFAPSAEAVIAARLVQGCSAGLLTPQSSGLIQTLFRGRERGIAFGLFGLTVSVSSAIGPIVGGLLIAAFGADEGWRWIFLVNVPIGVLLLVPIALMVPGRQPDGGSDARLDLVGAVLLGATVLVLLLPIVRLEAGGRGTLVLLAAVPVLAAGFVRWERRVVRRHGAPLLDVGLLRRVPGYASGIAVGTLYFTGFTGVFLVMSVYLQDARDLSALQTGALLTPFALGSAIASPLAGRFVDRVGRVMTVAALVTMLVGVGCLALAAPAAGGSTGWVLVGASLLLAGLGGGAVVSPNMTLALAEVPTRMGGAAGAALQTGQRIGAAVGAALVMTGYHLALTEQSAGAALRVALAVSATLLCAALATAVWAWRRG